MTDNEEMIVERVSVTRTTRRMTRPVRTVVEYWDEDGVLLARVTGGPTPHTASGSVDEGGSDDGEEKPPD